MEEILKIYNDGSHFVGTKFTRLPSDSNGDLEFNDDGELLVKASVNKGSTYNTIEFVSENKAFKKDIVYKKHESLKYYEDLIKSLISKYSLSDYSYSKIKEYVTIDFVKIIGDIVWYNQRGKAYCKDSKDFLKVTLKKFGKNLKERVKRFRQKAYNNKWNYFVTFTYDESLQNEESFVKKIKKKLSNLHTRHNWLYMGVFERSSIGRLHFHGLFYIPDGEMIGELLEVSDYSIEHHRRQKRFENNVFREQFGINDFKSLGKEDLTKGNILNYILKYIGKTGEPIYYSRGIKTFIYIKLNDSNDFILKMIDALSIRYVLFDDVLSNSVEINVKRMNC